MSSHWAACVISLFPEVFPGPLNVSLVGKALQKKLWDLSTISLRDFAVDKHGTVDDAPFGGGAGMLIRPDVVDGALKKAKEDYPNHRLLYLSPKGKKLTQEDIEGLSKEKGITLLCGRYEGVDQRVIDTWSLEEVSVGDYVLCGGEVAAMTLIEACVRWLPGIVGDKDSLQADSFQNSLLEHPHYTRPKIWRGQKVPDVLTSGHHEKISIWRQRESERLTKERRPDLWKRYVDEK